MFLMCKPLRPQSATIELLTARGGKNTELKLQVGRVGGREGGDREAARGHPVWVRVAIGGDSRSNTGVCGRTVLHSLFGRRRGELAHTRMDSGTDLECG